MKKFLMILGFVLLVGAGIFGVHTLLDRHKDGNVPSSQVADQGQNSKGQTGNIPVPVTPGFDKTAHSTTDPTSIWVVVNKKHPLNPINYTPSDLTSVGGGQQMRAEAAGALKSLLAGAKAADLTINPLSGYRSYDTQVSVYNSEVKQYGQTQADSESARPGYSEHQTGWAIDVGGGGCGIEDCFGNTPEGKWLAAHAYEYGYIIRYTAPKQSVTGYKAEPWHIRYVGTDLSKEMQEQGIPTLEEFFGVSGGNYAS